MPVYEEKITKDGKKKYYIKVSVLDENGKIKRITRRNRNWVGKTGQYLAIQEETRLRLKPTKKENTILINELVTKKMEQDKTYLKQSSITRYNEFFKKYIEPFFENKISQNITTNDIANWHNWLEKQNIHIESMKKIHNLLTSSINYGIKYYGLDKNVCELVGNFKNKRGYVKPEIQFLTYEEFNLFIKNETNSVYKDFFNLLFFTGMRRGELLALTWDDIDFEKKTIRINKSINPKNGTEATVPKTNKANRTIPITDFIYDILISMDKDDEKIFGLEKIKPSTLNRKCNKNCNLAGIKKHIRVHDLRHSFVALCIECGVQIERISEYVGHENISTTEIYSHVSNEKIKEDYEKHPHYKK